MLKTQFFFLSSLVCFALFAYLSGADMSMRIMALETMRDFYCGSAELEEACWDDKEA